MANANGLTSKANIDFLSNILRSFFADKYNTDVPLSILNGVVTDHASGFASANPVLMRTTPVEDINRRIISTAKESIKQRITQASQASAAAPPPPPQIPQVAQASQASQAPAPQAEEDDGPDESFMDRLQHLEIQRSITNAPPTQDISALKSVTDVLVGTKASASTVSSSTIFLQAPIKRGKEFVVRSWDRNWMSSKERNGIRVQNVPFIRDTSTQILYAFIPTEFCYDTPYIVVQVQGATGHIFQSYLFREHDHSHAHWVTFKPGSDSLGFTTPLALPWTMSILGADGMPLEMGDDGQVLEYISEYGMYKCEMGTGMGGIKPGHVAWLSVMGDLKRTKVLEVNVHENLIKFESHIIAANCSLLNYSKQWNIIFEISTTKTK